jgi:hypothetical protein
MRRRITVAETLGEVGGHLEWGTPKNHSQRSVPIPGFLADLLAGGGPRGTRTHNLRIKNLALGANKRYLLSLS